MFSQQSPAAVMAAEMQASGSSDTKSSVSNSFMKQETDFGMCDVVADDEGLSIQIVDCFSVTTTDEQIVARIAVHEHITGSEHYLLRNIPEGVGRPLVNTEALIQDCQHIQSQPESDGITDENNGVQTCLATEISCPAYKNEQQKIPATVTDCQVLAANIGCESSQKICYVPVSTPDMVSQCQDSAPLLVNLKTHREKHRIQIQFNNQVLDNKSHTDVKLCNQVESLFSYYKQFRCDDCGQRYATLSQLKKHLHTHTGNRPFVCVTCAVGFTKSYSLKRHIRTHTGEKPYQCPLCPRYFTDESNLVYHRRKHAAVTPGDSDFLGSVVVSRTHTTRSDEKLYKCELCGASFAYLCHLKPHRRIHTGEKPYVCDICGKTFTLVSNMSSHRRTHTGEKPYTCDICGVSFTFACSLKTHRRKHTGERPFRCDICDMGFMSTSTMKAHRRTHTGENPYKCDFCGLSCASQNHLMLHKRTHTGEKPYACDVCCLSFVSSSKLKTHKRTHTGEKYHKCDFCSVSFVTAGQLKTHRRTHTGEKPYKCEFCPRDFTHVNSLRCHRWLHTGEKPFVCSVCGVRFTNAKSLGLHRRSHT